MGVGSPSACGRLRVPATFAEQTSLSLLNCLFTSSKLKGPSLCLFPPPPVLVACEFQGVVPLHLSHHIYSQGLGHHIPLLPFKIIHDSLSLLMLVPSVFFLSLGQSGWHFVKVNDFF